MVRTRTDARRAGARTGRATDLAEEVVIVTTLAGEFFLNLLEQDQIWVTQDGRRMELEVMERSHRRNVLAMLERRLPDLYRDWLSEFLDEGVTVEQLAELGWVSRDPATGRYRPSGGRSWFEEQPLVRRLRAIQGDPSVPSPGR